MRLVCLLPDGKLDTERARQVKAMAAGRGLVFHRAFDDCQDPDVVERLVDIGVDRIMTSGGKDAALNGATAIATTIGRARGRIGVLPASQIGAGNVGELREATGCTEVHGTFGTRSTDSNEERIARIRAVISAFREG